LAGLAGGFALIVAAALIARFTGAGWLADCGRHSLAIYLAFVLPMGAIRLAILGAGIPLPPSLVALLVLAGAVAVPLALERLTRGTPARLIFSRPRWARLSAAEPAGR
jgi:uncharacterized membrane protein YcfT